MKFFVNHWFWFLFSSKGLPSHPQHELIKKQCFGVSGMLSFYIKGGLQESRKFLSALKVFTLAESLGGYESLAELPWVLWLTNFVYRKHCKWYLNGMVFIFCRSVMTHASVPPAQRAQLGITDNLIRLSVGLEDVDDLVADLEQALTASVSASLGSLTL